MSEKIWVRAALKPNAESRPITDRGLLYPHPQHRGRYIGWRDCMPGEVPEHVIPGAAGVMLENIKGATVVSYDVDPDKRKSDQHGGVGPVGDLYLAGPSLGMVRTAPVRVLEDSEIRRALACGDLEKAEDPSLVPAPAPVVEEIPVASPAVSSRLAELTAKTDATPVRGKSPAKVEA